MDGEPIKGGFYRQQIQTVPYDSQKQMYEVKVLAKKKLHGTPYVKVSWLGYGKRSKPEWIKASDLKSLSEHEDIRYIS